MENASKALLIAGAVLIVILLIGVGMMIYNGATGSVNSAISKMSSQEKQIFNQQFEQYEGSIKGSKVKSLISTVMTNNAENTDGDMQVTITGNVVATGEDEDKSLSATRTKIKSNTTYTVVLTYNDGGLVKSIAINEPTN